MTGHGFQWTITLFLLHVASGCGGSAAKTNGLSAAVETINQVPDDETWNVSPGSKYRGTFGNWGIEIAAMTFDSPVNLVVSQPTGCPTDLRIADAASLDSGTFIPAKIPIKLSLLLPQELVAREPLVRLTKLGGEPELIPTASLSFSTVNEDVSNVSFGVGASAFSVSMGFDEAGVGCLADEASSEAVETIVADHEAAVTTIIEGGGDSEGSGAASPDSLFSDDYSLGGAVANLSGDVILRTGEATVQVSQDGAFSFSKLFADGAAYQVEVSLHPESQYCTVTNAAGTFAGENVTDIDVTCVTTIFRSDFSQAAVGASPGLWEDSAGNWSLESGDTFQVKDLGEVRVLAPGSASLDAHTHAATTGSSQWSNYTVTSQIFVQDATDPYGFGLSLLSDFPASTSHYRFGYVGASAFTLSGAGGTSCDASTGLVPIAGSTYLSLVKTENLGDSTRVRAKVWPIAGVEPADWQAECVDTSPTRRAAGKPGLFASGQEVGGLVSMQVVQDLGHKVSVSVSGLSGNVTVSNHLDQVVGSSNGELEFSTTLAPGGAYALSVTTQPAGQWCWLSDHTGLANGDVVATLECVDELSLAGTNNNVAVHFFDSAVWQVHTGSPTTIGEWNGFTQATFVRFELPSSIPAGSRISSAVVSLNAGAGSNLEATDVIKITTEDSCNSVYHTTIAERPVSLGGSTSLTSSSVSWIPQLTWTEGSLNPTPDLATVLQDLVDKCGGLAAGAGVSFYLSMESVESDNDENYFNSLTNQLAITFAPPAS